MFSKKLWILIINSIVKTGCGFRASFGFLPKLLKFCLGLGCWSDSRGCYLISWGCIGVIRWYGSLFSAWLVDKGNFGKLLMFVFGAGSCWFRCYGGNNKWSDMRVVTAIKYSRYAVKFRFWGRGKMSKRNRKKIAILDQKCKGLLKIFDNYSPMWGLIWLIEQDIYILPCISLNLLMY